MPLYSLHIDESGSSQPFYQVDRPYILVGCAIDNKNKDLLKEKANELKMKYWNKTNIVLHHADLARNSKEFAIFKGRPDLKIEFKNDLIKFLHRTPVNVFVSVIDKERIQPYWTEHLMVKRTARTIFFDYIAYLYSNKYPRGEIIIEACQNIKDWYYLEAFSYFLSPACKELDNDFRAANNIKDVIACVSFVTKQNNDIETQIADIFGYAAYCLYQQMRGLKNYKKGSYEARLIGALKDKLFRMHPQSGPEKIKFLSKVESYKISWE